LTITHLGVLGIRIIDVRGVEIIVLVFRAKIVIQEVGHLVGVGWRVSLRNVERVKRLFKALKFGRYSTSFTK
jgi:hypothetical protein